MSVTRFAVIVAVSVSIIACAGKDQGFYKHSPSVSSLEVPPDLTHPEVDDTYAIPQIGHVLKKEPVLKDGTRVKVMRDGAIRWLEIEGDIDQIWERSREFWLQGDTGLAWENRAHGIMETEWVRHYDSKFAEDKFRLRIEPGKQKGSIALFVSHRGRQQIVSQVGVFDRWTDRLSDPELEIEVTGLLLQHLGMEPDQAASKAAEKKTSEILASVKTDKGVTALWIKQPKDSAWALLMRAIDRAGYIIDERDQAVGQIRLSTGSEDDGALAAFNVFGKSKKDFDLKVEEINGETRIIVLNDKKEADSSSAVKEFFNRIQNRI